MPYVSLSRSHSFTTRLSYVVCSFLFFFFFNDTATTEIYTLSLHDALPISSCRRTARGLPGRASAAASATEALPRSEEHTSELQSLRHLVCRLLLEKKKNTSQLHKTSGHATRHTIHSDNPVERRHE